MHNCILYSSSLVYTYIYIDCSLAHHIPVAVCTSIVLLTKKAKAINSKGGTLPIKESPGNILKGGHSILQGTSRQKTQRWAHYPLKKVQAIYSKVGTLPIKESQGNVLKCEHKYPLKKVQAIYSKVGTNKR